jgi:pimeloyl-ACP methyl ester carboxylesterase
MKRYWVVALMLASAFALRAQPAAAPWAPAPVPQNSFDSGILHVDRFGSGPQAIVLIPGLSCGTWVWNRTISRLCGRYSVYAISLPGFDGRPATARKPLFSAFQDDFWAMLTAQGISKPIVIGHSLGGTLAIALAESHPERLAAIVSIDGLPIFPMLANATPQEREATAAESATAYATLDATAELAAEEGYMQTIGTNRPEYVKAAARLEARSDPKAVATWLAEDLATDLRPGLANLTVPFLEVMPYNPADSKPPMAYTEEQALTLYRALVTGAPAATVVPIAPSRHFVMLDQPEALDQALTTFLAGLH